MASMLLVPTLVLTALPSLAIQDEDVESVAPEVVPAPVRRYHGPDDAEELLAAWSASGVVESYGCGLSAGERPLVVVQLGGIGEVPLDERPCVLLLGGLDGVSVSGSEAVIAIIDSLVAMPEELPGDVTLLAIPWANPDGLAAFIEHGFGNGRNAHALDEDGDGQLDEDGPDDIDGDGVLLELLVPGAAGAWTRAASERFPRRAQAGDRTRFHRLPEGSDEDGDGLFNEDGPGGVVLDHDFPVGWWGPWTGTAAGPWPLSEPGTRALADLARVRSLACVLVFQGNHGGLGLPGGVIASEARDVLPFDGDEPAWRFLIDSFRAATGRSEAQALPLREARGEPWPGAAIDWFYAAVGVPAVEVAVWGPNVGMLQMSDGNEAQSSTAPRELPVASGAAPVSGDAAWSDWLDETQSGIGFVDWQPTDLGGGRVGWLGGWEPYTIQNPPVASLEAATHGLADFVLEVARGLPRPVIDVREARRDGQVVFLRARVKNGGRLPSGVGPHPRPRGTVFKIEGPEGMQILAGSASVRISNLGGGESSDEIEWIVIAPEGSPFRLIASFEGGEAVVREVRP